MCLEAYHARNQCRCELVYRKEGDDETIFQMEQSIARIVRLTVKHAQSIFMLLCSFYIRRGLAISFVIPNTKDQGIYKYLCPYYTSNIPFSVCIRQDYKVTTDFITCTWQWITAVSMVFILILLM